MTQVNTMETACGHTYGCGCQYASCCFECPLAECKYAGGRPDRATKARASLRREFIVRALERGVELGAIASATGVSRERVRQIRRETQRVAV